MIRRQSITLPKGLDRLQRTAEEAAMGMASVGATETVKQLSNTKNKLGNNVNALEAELAKARQREEIATLSRRSSRKLKRHATLAADEDDFQLHPLLLAGASVASASGIARRNSFVDDKTLAQAQRLCETEHSTEGNQMRELSKWLNTEMISRKEAEGVKAGNTSGQRMSIRQVLKVDDRIDLDECRAKKYTELEIDPEEKKREEEEAKRQGSKDGVSRAKLRHTTSYRRQTIE